MAQRFRQWLAFQRLRRAVQRGHAGIALKTLAQAPGAAPRSWRTVLDLALGWLSAQPEDEAWERVCMAIAGTMNPQDALVCTIGHFHAEIGLPNDEGWRHRRLVILSHLLANGADANAPDLTGARPLHTAVACRDADCVELLMRLGADGMLRDGHGLTARDVLDDRGQRSSLRAMVADVACSIGGDVLQWDLDGPFREALGARLEAALMDRALPSGAGKGAPRSRL